MLTVSLDCVFLIASSFLFNVYIIYTAKDELVLKSNEISLQRMKFLLSISQITSVTPSVPGTVAVVVLVQKFGVSVAYTVSPSFL